MFSIGIHLPRGRGLPAAEFDRRHQSLVGLLWACVAALPLYSTLQGYDGEHAALHAVPLVSIALVASARALGRRVRATFCALGLLTAAAVFVHAAHGLTEAHFAFFVLVVCLTLYEDWLPFLVTVAFVLVHHGVFGMIQPEAVYSGVSLGGSSWKWAAIHALFVAAAGAAAIVVWGANEKLREDRERLIERLAALSLEDQLTGLANRRAWDERFGEEIRRATRSARPLSVAMLDLDNLKVVNDDLGHQAGDRVLRTAAATWTEAIRETDFISRLGGDEFGILLPDCDTAGAAGAVQRLLDAMPPGHTVSAGIATWDRREPVTALVKRADAALYAAKNAGRGQLQAAPPSRFFGAGIASASG